VPFYPSDERFDNGAASKRIAVCLSISLLNTLIMVLPQ